MASISDILSAVQNGVVAVNNLTIQMKGSLLNIRSTTRVALTAPATYFVRADGSNNNNGLSNTSIGAFLTIQKAIDTVSLLDIKNFSVGIFVADGTYASTGDTIALKSFVGTGIVSIVGNVTTPANVIINTTSGSCVTGQGVTGTYAISGLKLVALTAGFNCISVSQATRLTFSFINFGAANIQIASTTNAIIIANSSYTISAGANIHWYATLGGFIQVAGFTVTLTGTPAYSQAFAWAQQHGRMSVNADTFTGAATGTRYFADTFGLIDTQGGGATYLPGSVGGSVTPPGFYQ